MISLLAVADSNNHPPPFSMVVGERYLCDRSLAGDFIKGGAPCEERIEDFNAECRTSLLETLAGFGPECPQKIKVLIIRSGGMGDLLFLTPALVKLRATYPEHSFTVCSMAEYQPMLSRPELEGVDFLAYPPLMSAVEAFDVVIPLEETVERDDEQDSITIFAQALGVTLEGEERFPKLKIPSDVLLAATEKFAPFAKMKRYGIQLKASHDCRTWPFNYIQALTSLILDRDSRAVVFLFGKKADWPDIEEVQHPRMIWLPLYDLSLVETLAVMSLMDGFVGPDSGLLHVASALDIPGVAIFGPYVWQQRILEGSSIHGINGYAECAPCHHKARFTAFPVGMPCEKLKCCVAMAQVQPERVWSQLKRKMDDEAMKRQGKSRIPQHLYTLGSMFGGILRKGDAHPELPRAEEYHLGDWGGGSAAIEEAEFIHSLVLALKPSFCLETGTETGWTAAHIAAALERNGKGHLVTLELDEKKAELSRQNLAAWDLGHRVKVLNQSSFGWFESRIEDNYENEYGDWDDIDFALLDTHIELRAQELELLVPHLSANAFVVVHDTSPLHPHAGDSNLLEKLRTWPGFDVVHLPTPRGLTVLARRAE